ncbi:CynX/NimT family MFS transporter [Marinobacter fonticola]|uniref:CynX/NimT family MFS transporter n=1 Tax=Marinobacter fonticola TaxID=2603215 RepID=UPI0011E6A182|nr:MFS transporter [Marinobacter fonticola]
MTQASVKSRASSTLLTLTGLLFVALNLRPALTSVSPVLTRIGEGLALSSFGQGILTTLPVLFLGLCAPLAPRLARRIGVDRAVLAATAMLGTVLLLRPYSGVIGLFAGTLIAGGCIGVMGVLLPGVVKRDFPATASILTGFYTAVLCLGASAAAGATEPLRLAFGGDWQAALAIWTIPAWVAVVFWWLQLDGKHIPKPPSKPARSLFRDPLAWQVTLYMGLQSSLAYSVFGWLPTILQDRGLTPVDAGIGLSVSILIQIGSAIAAPWISSHMRDQRVMIALVVLFTGAGLLGCIYAPIGGIWFWVVILGLGQGGTFSMALTLLAVRARDHETAARLSGMAQGVGYTLAATGPLVLGLLHDSFHNWQVAGVFIGVIALATLLFGIAAGRPLYVGDVR